MKVVLIIKSEVNTDVLALCLSSVLPFGRAGNISHILIQMLLMFLVCGIMFVITFSQPDEKHTKKAKSLDF